MYSHAFVYQSSTLIGATIQREPVTRKEVSSPSIGWLLNGAPLVFDTVSNSRGTKGCQATRKGVEKMIATAGTAPNRGKRRKKKKPRARLAGQIDPSLRERKTKKRAESTERKSNVLRQTKGEVHHKRPRGCTPQPQAYNVHCPY